MKDNSKHTVILYLHYLGRVNDLIAKNSLGTTKKPETSMADHKGDDKHEKQIG